MSGKRVYAIVLAAGMSTRTTRFKLLERIGGKSLLERVIANVRGTSLDGGVVVLGFEAERVRKEVSLQGLEVVVNPRFHEGMSTSLKLGFRSVEGRADGALVVLADQPFVTPTDMKRVVKAYRTHSKPIVVPVHRGRRGNPVLLGLELADEVEALEGDVGAKPIILRHAGDVFEVGVDNPAILQDIDTDEDLSRLNVKV